MRPGTRRPVALAPALAVAVAVAVTAAAGAFAPAAAAAPYTPASDDEILERLPPGLRSADLRRQREELAADPENLRDSVAMARSYADTARLEGDARFLGHAQAILAPWWNLPSPPPGVLLVRAQVRELSFEFDRALADLEALIRQAPDHAPAQAARLEILLARGDPTAAAAAWEQARPLLPPLAAAVGHARCRRLTGAATEAYAALRDAVAAQPEADPADRHTARLLLGEVAEQIGRPAAAAEHYAAVRQLGRRDVEALAVIADFLLDQRQFEEVTRLLAAETASDPLALRLLEAWQALPARDPEDAAARETLTRQLVPRLASRRQRGDATVLPDELRLFLRVTPDPGQAADRARDLWAVRRELGDVRLILEAARAAAAPAVARPVTDWLRTNGIVDARLAPLLDAPGPPP